MGFIPVEQRQLARLGQAFEFGQCRALGGAAHGVGPAFYPAADAFVAATKAFKKARNVSRPTAGLPLARWACSAALARAMRYRLAGTAVRMAASSWATLRNGLRPRPGLVFRPSIPCWP